MRLGVTLRDASGNVGRRKDVFADASEVRDRWQSTPRRPRLPGRGALSCCFDDAGQAGVAALVAEAAELGVVFGGDSVQALLDADDKLVRLRYA